MGGVGWVEQTNKNYQLSLNWVVLSWFELRVDQYVCMYKLMKGTSLTTAIQYFFLKLFNISIFKVHTECGTSVYGAWV